MKSDVEQAYEKWAKSYDKDAKWNPAIRMEGDWMIRFLNLKKPDKVLEIGCGTGRLTIPIAKKCLSIVAADFSSQMLELAKKKSETCKNISYMKLDARKKLPFPDSSFHKVISPLLTNHIENIQGFFDEVYRILKTDGVFVFDDPNPDSRDFSVRHHSVLDDMYDQGKKLYFSHSIDDYVHSLHRSHFEIEQTRFIRIDEKIRSILTTKSYERNKGRTFGFIFKARKIE